jgi:hypothetical protein
VDRAVGERLGQRIVDEPVLVDEGKTGEVRADHGHVEVIAPSGAVDDLDPTGVGKGLFEQVLEPFAHGSEDTNLVNVQVDADQDQRP